MTEGPAATDRGFLSRLCSGSSHWLLLAILAAGIVLRAWGIADRVLWIDEYGTWWTIAGETWCDCWNRALREQEQSPLYYLTARLSVQLLGLGALSLRLPSLLFGIGLLALGYPLALRLFRDHRIALLTVLAFALSDRLVYYSQEARPYAMGLLQDPCGRVEPFSSNPNKPYAWSGTRPRPGKTTGKEPQPKDCTLQVYSWNEFPSICR